jgi:hypothetical protein
MQAISEITTTMKHLRELTMIVGRGRLWDQTGDLSNGGFLALRNPKESEDAPEILRPTRPCANRKLVRDIRRATRKHHSAEDKNCTVS